MSKTESRGGRSLGSSVCLLVELGLVTLLGTVSPAIAVPGVPGIVFEENKGQYSPQVAFGSRNGQVDLFVLRDRLSVSLRSARSVRGSFDLRFLGANPEATVHGEELERGVVNYLRGSLATQRHTNVRIFSRVRIREAFPGIDVVVYDRNGQFEFDFVLSREAGEGRIRMGFEGVDSLAIDEAGGLVIRTAGEEIRQSPPVAYQQLEGRRSLVDASYELLARIIHESEK